MTKRLISVFAAVTLVGSMLTACGSAQNDNGTAQTNATAGESKPDTDSSTEQEDREPKACAAKVP